MLFRSQQTLSPPETRKFPVVFVVDPKLPKDVGTITLSYTFFEIGKQQGSVDDKPQLPGAAKLRVASVAPGLGA